MKYTYIKRFTRNTEGVMKKGMTVRENMSFTSAERFFAWVDGINAKNKEGKCPYLVEYWQHAID